MFEKYLSREKPGNMARYRQPNVPEDDQDNQDRSQRNSQSSEPFWEKEEININSASGKVWDPEKAKDVNLINWQGPNGPERPENWTQGKKFLMSFEL